MATIILLLFLAVLLTITVFGAASGARSRRRRRKLGHFVFASVPPLILWGICATLAQKFSAHAAMELALVSCALLLVELLLSLVIFGWVRRRRIWISCAALCLCAAIVGEGVFVQTWHWEPFEPESVQRMRESENLFLLYNPRNEDNRLARLVSEPSFTPTGELPQLDGATALYPVYAAFANALYPADALGVGRDMDPLEWFEFEEDPLLRCSTTSGAYAALVDGEADVIFAAAPSEAQRRYAEERGEEMIFTPIGREAFVFFVNSQNPVENLSSEQLRGIYSGTITDWSELGAEPGEIRAFQRSEGSGSQSALLRFMGDAPLMSAPTASVMDDMGGIIEVVADYRNDADAIGFSFRFYCTDMVRNDQIRLLSVDGVAPTVENIADGSYPLASEFYAVTLASNENQNAAPLIEWILSEQGQDIIERTGYVPI